MSANEVVAAVRRFPLAARPYNGMTGRWIARRSPYGRLLGGSAHETLCQPQCCREVGVDAGVWL